MRDDSVRTYQFGPLKVGVRGLGVYFGGPILDRSLDALTAEELQKVNREAWKQKRKATAAANRVNNVTVHGCGPHDIASAHENVADVVAKQSWNRICRAKESA